jgi:low affinity Fe/Cu permease
VVEFSQEGGRMGRKPHNSFGRVLERLATGVTHWTGGTSAFALAVATIIVWLVTGPVFGYSDTWQLIINTGTTIVTFLMVFLIQRTQNKDSLAIHLKLNEIVAALDGASNHLIEVESLSEDELDLLRRHYHKLVTMAAHDVSLTKSHSVEEAGVRHRRKARAPKIRKDIPGDTPTAAPTDASTDAPTDTETKT